MLLADRAFELLEDGRIAEKLTNADSREKTLFFDEILETINEPVAQDTALLMSLGLEGGIVKPEKKLRDFPQW